MESGWIKLFRKLQDNKLWHSEPFTKGQAWVDLLMLASHADRVFFKRGIEVKQERGVVGISEIGLADRWKWSRGKVRRFLNWLSVEQQIVQKKNRVTTLIKIINYSEYQGDSTTDSTTNGTTDGHNQECKEYIYKNILGEKPDPPPEPVKKKTNKIFIKPTVDEIKQYCQERKNGIDPQRFFDFNEAKGWMIGKNKMKDWRAAVRTWENNKKGNGASEEKKEYTPPPKKCGTCYHFFRVDKYSGEKTCFDKNPEEKTCYKYTLDPCAISRKFINNQVNP